MDQDTYFSLEEREEAGGQAARAGTAAPRFVAPKPRIEIEPIDGAAWDAIAADRFHDVRQEQLFRFVDTRWNRLDNQACLFRRDGEIVGGCVVMSLCLPLKLGGLSVVRWGPLIGNRSDACANAIDRQTYDAIVMALVEEFSVRRGAMLSIAPPLWPGEPEWAGERLLALGFKPGVRLPSPNRYFVNLQPALEDIHAGFEQKWRYNLKKAERADLSFKVASGKAGLATFAALYEAMSERKRFPDYSAYPTLATLMDIEHAALRPQIFLLRHGGAPVAGAVIFTAGDVATYLYGATSDEALPLNAGYLIHWRVIEWLKANRAARWYDLGGSDGFHGLHQFKKGMVGRDGWIAELPPLYDYAHGVMGRLFGEALYTARGAKSASVRLLNKLKPSG